MKVGGNRLGAAQAITGAGCRKSSSTKVYHVYAMDTILARRQGRDRDLAVQNSEPDINSQNIAITPVTVLLIPCNKMLGITEPFAAFSFKSP